MKTDEIILWTQSGDEDTEMPDKDDIESDDVDDDESDEDEDSDIEDDEDMPSTNEPPTDV